MWVSVFRGVFCATGIFRQFMGEKSVHIFNISLLSSLLLLAFLLLMDHAVADAHAVTGGFAKGCTKVTCKYLQQFNKTPSLFCIMGQKCIF
jgi:hypothetical protein